MYGTVDSVDYEHFDYKLYDQEPMELDEACRKASEMRANDKKHHFRVVPANRDMTRFHVDSVPVSQYRSELIARFLSSWVSLFARYTRRNG